MIIEVTNSTFDAPHPNQEHVTGVIYDPVNKCALVKTKDGLIKAELRDFILVDGNGSLNVLTIRRNNQERA